MDIWKRILQAQTYDHEVTQAIETILKSGYKTISKGLEDWNYKNGIIYHRGHVYVPKDPNLRRDIVKMYYDSPATGHPG